MAMIDTFAFQTTRADRLRVFLTAGEAYPALERAFLEAQDEIWGSFRIFDPATKLRSREARDVGATWFDLIQHTLERGVAIHMVVSDFDPICWSEGHRGTWRAVRMFLAAAELTGPGAKLTITPAMHAARSGIVPRLVFWPMVMAKLIATARKLDRMAPDMRRAALRDLPGVKSFLREGKGGRLHPKWASLPKLYPASHHQKLAVFDRELLYVGGLDLDERRFDTVDHDRPGNQTWHDVQLMLRGPAAAEAQTHLESFRYVTAGQTEPAPQRCFLRTMSRPQRRQTFSIGPDTVVQDIAVAHEMLARRATRLIYLENQYFRDRRMARFLAGIGRDNPEIRLILILPAAPDDVAFDGSDGLDARYGEHLQLRALRILRKGFGDRLFVGGVAQRRRATRETDHDRDRLKGAPIIYLHAKVSIFDAMGAIVSSANLNGRSLRWDTEAGVLLDRARDVELLRRRVMRHWLPEAAGPEYLNPDTALESWRDLANANARVEPELRQGFLLPYDFKAPTGIATPVPGVPEEMV